MPNPYMGNDRAAAFVEFYASDRMVASSVDRLYRGGVARREQAREEAARQAYPELYEPPVRRTQAEIDQYLQARVETELLRRQQRRVALQQELRPQIEAPPLRIPAKDVRRQVRRLYTESLRQRAQREEELERIFGKPRSEEDIVYAGRSPREVAEMRALESGWRPPSASVPHEDDNRASLASHYDYYANPKKFNELVVQARQRRAMSPRERAQQMKRLTELSQPLSVTPRRVEEVKGPADPPPFRVHRKVDHADAMPPPGSSAIRAMSLASDEGVSSLFIGRANGTIEKYLPAADADLGRPTLVLRGHRGAITGLAVVSSDELYSSSLDGSIKQWDASVELDTLSANTTTMGTTTSAAPLEGGSRVLRSLDGPVPLHCLAMQPGGGRLYAGGGDGALCVVDGDRRSTWPGLGRPITSVAVSPDGALILTGDADGAVVAWDPQEGRALVELKGHTAAVTGFAFVEPTDEAEGDEGNMDGGSSAGGSAGDIVDPRISPAAGAIVTFAQDMTVRVWAMPDPANEGMHAEEDGSTDGMTRGVPTAAANDALSGAGASGRGSSGAGIEGDSRHSPAAVVSFQIPVDAGDDDGERAESEAHKQKRVSFELQPVLAVAPAESADASAADEANVTEMEAAPLEPITGIINAPVNIKSALKAPERPRLRQELAVGTIELPATPHSVYQAGLHESVDDGDGGAGDGAARNAALVYVGSVSGTVWGLQLTAIVRTVLRFVSESRRRVQREIHSTERLLRKSEARVRRECRTLVKRETDKQVRIAAKVHGAKRSEERRKLREERAAAARAAAAAQRASASVNSDEDEEGEGEEELPYDEEMELGNEEEETEEEDFGAEEDGGAENGDAGGGAFSTDDAAAERRLRERELRHLTPEQRTALDAFVLEQETLRNKQLAELTQAAQAHLAKVRPLAQATYERPRADFARLSFTSYASVAPSATPQVVGGSVQSVSAAALRRGPKGPDGEDVLAIVASAGRVYAAQAGRVVISRVTPGLVRL